MAKVMDRATIEYIMRSMTTNDRALQRQVLQQYITDDAKFTHFLGDVCGKDAMYGVYRAAVTGINYKLKFIEMIIDEQGAAVWLDLNIKLAPFFIKRYHAPTVVLLKFRRGQDGLMRICEQVDHHSIFVFMWALGWPFSAFWDIIVRRLEGALLCTTGWAIDAAEDTAKCFWDMSASLLGGALGKTLPQPVLEVLGKALPGFVAEPLGLSRVAGLADGVGRGWNGAVADAADAAGHVVAAVGSALAAAAEGGRHTSGKLSAGANGTADAAAAAAAVDGGHHTIHGGLGSDDDAAAASSTNAGQQQQQQQQAQLPVGAFTSGADDGEMLVPVNARRQQQQYWSVS